MTRTTALLAAPLLAATLPLLVVACDKPEPKELAPEAQALTAPEKAPADARSFIVDTGQTAVGFQMDAELEKIEGRAPASTSGTLSVDLTDLSKTTGFFKVDLLQLSLYQEKRDDGEGEFSSPEKNEAQNGHMRVWLQISDDGPADVREKNRFIEFKIEQVTPDGSGDVSSLSGDERTVPVTVTGSLRLHGRVSPHTFKATATFNYADGQPTALRVKTLEPIPVSLDAHDVRPRKAFDILADKTLDAMGQKVAKVAQVSLDLKATMK